MCASPENFAAQLQILKQYASIVPLEQVNKQGRVAITFNELYW